MTIVARPPGGKVERRKSRKLRLCSWACGTEIQPSDLYLLHTAYPGADGMEYAARPSSIAECLSCALKYGRGDCAGLGAKEATP